MILHALYLLLSLLLCHQAAAQDTPYPLPFGYYRGPPNPAPPGVKVIEHGCSVDLGSLYNNNRLDHSGFYECPPFTFHVFRNAYCNELGNYLYAIAEVHDKGAWTMEILGGHIGGSVETTTLEFAKQDYGQSRHVGCVADGEGLGITLFSDPYKVESGGPGVGRERKRQKWMKAMWKRQEWMKAVWKRLLESIMMHSLAYFSLAAVVAASVTPPGLSHRVEGIEVPAIKDIIPAVTVVQENRTYAVKLECAGCPFVSWERPHEAEWQHPPPDNSLMLMFKLDESQSALLLDDHRIFPLDPMPLHIGAMQVPNDMDKGALDEQMGRGFRPDAPGGMRFPLQYEHSVFRAEGPGSMWLQFNVTGLAFGEDTEPFQLGQNVIQVLLRAEDDEDDYKLSIGVVQVVQEKNMAQAPRMECGRLAMVKTTFDPNQWDEFGKFGTWSRTWNLVIGRLGDYWSDHLEDNMMLLPLLVLLSVSIVMASRFYQSRQQDDRDSDAETALLGHYAPPPYRDIPVIKIEEYD
ncbi:hypothetical protein A1F96_09677 [Pyrenophora tritici-repentis]|uniref:Uncharacterized protein n=2 Tax=Pyrenophora tritici-repentis TaxID=45151 RepID=A0A2W1H0F6_9PLEO|nr:hypothetical protein PtrM4_017660 [Pyrenophora tritici-repentis]KAI1513462.1 hypothetical protein Ptr86124_007364 [Pyrenophora tritici-repentis]KAI1688470.1 hypothetical protein KJE20_01647 [Pyrenophora tritici-repentis]PWO20452.1 SPS1, Serinethreonine protein kinase [Pyrenophora tritici-repentis]PZD24059.1 hypothetical protein A1F96_09677 [Pyrenophora tritici-repentis]